jgi:peptide/nickel transport system permease protein
MTDAGELRARESIDRSSIDAFGEPTAAVSPSRDLAARIARNPAALGGLVIVVVVAVLAAVAPVVAPRSPLEMQMLARFKPPAPAYPLGTDNFGRDLAARILFGARISLTVGLLAALLTTLLGGLAGAVAGFAPRADGLVMRMMDALMAFPSILLAIAIMTALGPNQANAILALGIVYAPRTARIVRAAVLQAAAMDYVEAARALGAGPVRILFARILPNCLSPIIVQFTFVFAYAVLAEASLSFIGVGTPPPAPSWGNILAEGRVYMREAPWITLFPGAAIAVTVLGLNLAGDGLRDVLDPRMRGEG